MFEALVKETLDGIIAGGWVAFSAFGLYLGYKLALTTVISVSVLKVINKIFERVSHSTSDQRIIQLVAAAGMEWPLTDEEWKELTARVRAKK